MSGGECEIFSFEKKNAADKLQSNVRRQWLKERDNTFFTLPLFSNTCNEYNDGVVYSSIHKQPQQTSIAIIASNNFRNTKHTFGSKP